MLIIGAGGGLEQLRIAGGVGDAIGRAAAGSAISPLLLGWRIAVASGSATVATITASG